MPSSRMRDRNNRWPVALAFAVILTSTAHCYGQSAVNYAFSTSTTASLTDMTGSTLLVGPNVDDADNGGTVPIGFDVFFFGFHFTSFSASSNGVAALGIYGFTGAPYNPIGQYRGFFMIAPFASNQSTSPTGKVHYKLIGTAPNRVLVIEWLNMSSSATPAGADLTYQLRIYETSNAFEFVYGSMTMSAAGAADSTSNSAQLAFGYQNFSGSCGGVTVPQSGGTITYDGLTVPAASNTYSAGAIANLTSANNGARRNFMFAPPIPNPATNLTFPGVGSASLVLNWNASDNAAAYQVFQSTDNVNFTYLNKTTSTSFTASGLTPSTTYYFKVQAMSTEGGLSAAISGAQATSAPQTVSSVGSGGNWSSPATWSTGTLPSIYDTASIISGSTVTLDLNSVTVAGLVVDGLLTYTSTPSRSLTVSGDVTVDSGGSFNVTSAQFASHGLSVAGNLTNNGSLSFNSNGGGARITFTGSNNATFGGSGSTFISTLTVNKGSDATSVLELNPSSFGLFGSGGFLTLTKGTFKISGSFSMTNAVFPSTFVIAAGTGLWLNNPNFTLNFSATSNGTNSGTLRVSQGTFSFGSGGANDHNRLGGNDGAIFTFDGGTANFTHGFAPTGAVTVTVSGGTINANNFSNTGNSSWDLSNASANFIMSGGTIKAVNRNASNGPGTFDYRAVCNTTFTGGTVVLGSFQAGTYHFIGAAPSLTIGNGGNAVTAQLLDAASVAGNITVNSSCTLDTNGFTLSMLGPNITNNGAIVGTVAGSAVNFAGTAAQNYSGTGTFGTLTAPFGGSGVTINNTNGVSFNTDVVTSMLTLSSGIASMGANNMIIPSGGAVTHTSGYVAGNLRRTFTAAGTQTFDVGAGGGSSYSPVTVNATSATFPADVTIHASAGAQPNYPGITALKRYWTFTAPANLVADLTFQYPGVDVAGNESAYEAARYAGGFASFAASVNTSTHTAVVGGATGLSGDWLLLEQDSDFDGMPDAWEIGHGLNPNDPSDASLDSDGDGMTNLQEFFAGTDPQNSTSTLRIISITHTGSTSSVNFNAVANKPYRLEFKNSLTDSIWQIVADLNPNVTGPAQITDNAATAPARSYRIRLLLP